MSNFEKAASLDVEKWMASFPDEFPDYEFSDSYIRFRAKLIDKMRGGKYHRLTKKATAIVIIAAILLSMTIVAFAATVGKDFILKHFNGYAEVEVSDVENADYVTNFTISYIPEGFVKTDEDCSKMGYSYTYSNGDLWFNIGKSVIDGTGSYTEESAIKIIEKNNIKYYLSESVDSKSLIWNNGIFFYDINGNVSLEQLLEIAQSAS